MSQNNLKILNISLDRSVLKANSPVLKRIASYSNLVDSYTVLVPAEKNIELEVSSKLKIIGVEIQDKITGLRRIFKTASDLIKSENYNLISVQDQYYLGLVGLRLARKYKIGLEIQVHGFEKEKGLRKMIARYVLPRASAIRTVSNRLQKKLVENYKVDVNKITVAPIFVDLSERVVAKHPSSIFTFLTVCRLVPVKNIQLQIKAMSELVREGLSVRLWIVGDGPGKNKLEKLSKTLKVENDIKFFGWQNDLDNFYNQADVFLLTSLAEGWPLAIVEACHFSLPIIMTDVGSAGELVVDNESGLVIPVNDGPALTVAMKKVMADGDLRKRIGETAKIKVAQQLSWEETMKLYKQSWEKARS